MLKDGSKNVVWQRQVQTKYLVLKKKSTHAKFITQRIFPNSDARELVEDLYKKLG